MENENNNLIENSALQQTNVMRSFSSSFDDVMGRMFNWKMNSAVRMAENVENFPDEALTILKQMADKFGNCGWQDGSIYNELIDNNNRVADILGYEFCDDADGFWRKKNFT